jgi:amino acid transporter/mannitol/fructose-specific phosphotransferase system IIA component (Ntr-type)
MISSGLFVLPGLAHAKTGPSVVVSYLLAGVLASAGVLSVAELATAMPKAGGDYFFISRSMGPAVGTVAGLLSWFSLSLKSAFALVGMGALAQVLTPFDGRGAALLMALAFVGLNVFGVREAARLQVTLVIILFVLMLLYAVQGLPEVRILHFEPFTPAGLAAVISTAGFVFVSYGGVLKIASLAEETMQPGRTIPLGMILSLLTVTVLYTLTVFVTCGVLPVDQLANSLTPISDGAAVFMGRAGQIALNTAAALAFLTTANAGIMSASRYLFALGRDGQLPKWVCRLGATNGAPYTAVAITGVVVIMAIFVKLSILVEAASLVFMLSFALSNLSVVVLRESGLQSYRPQFRAPLYPWLQIAGITGLALVIMEMGEDAFFIGAALVVAGFCTYWFYGRQKAKTESALVHLIHRIAAKELAASSLESELRDIVRHRDNIVSDQFDRLIEKSIVLDLRQDMTLEEFTALAAEKLSVQVNMRSSALADRLLTRERQSSTVLSSFLAIPHVVVEGRKTFDILIARSRQGIEFSEHARSVHAIFILLGTQDERNLHLRVLSAIAQVATDKSFEKRWLAARDTEGIRNLILLSARRRD